MDVQTHSNFDGCSRNLQLYTLAWLGAAELARVSRTCRLWATGVIRGRLITHSGIGRCSRDVQNLMFQWLDDADLVRLSATGRFWRHHIREQLAKRKAKHTQLVLWTPLCPPRFVRTAGAWHVPGSFVGGKTPPAWRDHPGSLGRRFVIVPFQSHYDHRPLANTLFAQRFSLHFRDLSLS